MEKIGLGVSCKKRDETSFRMWAPYAYGVDLLLYKKSPRAGEKPCAEFPLKPSGDGVWQIRRVDCSVYSYYKYRVQSRLQDGQERTYEVCDIWAKSCGPDSIASQIADINDGATAVPARSQEVYDGSKKNYTNPWKGRSYTEAVIYEMHIRDWSRVEDPESTGKFLDLAQGSRVVKYIKSLGVTHVQLLPCFDYAQTNDDPGYNWGYNPYNYNVPEGRYVRGMRDGTDAVRQFRALVQRFHRAGIAVIMDVVYNHTYGTGGDSIYDMTAPSYFYRHNADGSLSDGSGCGNEVDTSKPMVRNFILDSLRNWMLGYHINGFRFDLMGLHETETMALIYNELSSIDRNVMVYGEPWTGGISAVQDGVRKESVDLCAPDTRVNGVACFNDNFRDAIKGAEFMGFRQGHVQGIFSDAEICEGLTGSANLTGRIGRMINYVECHDNFTLFDKLAMSRLGLTEFSGNLFEQLRGSGGNAMDAVKRQDVLCAAYILLAQGTPFLNGGQEFLRTKKGDDNSYVSGDDVNEIDFTFHERHSDVYFTYKGLIALRRRNPRWFGMNSEASARTLSEGVTLYRTGPFVIYFNAADSEFPVESCGCIAMVDVSTGEPKIKRALPETVGPKSFLILTAGEK